MIREIVKRLLQKELPDKDCEFYKKFYFKTIEKRVDTVQLSDNNTQNVSTLVEKLNNL